VAKKQNSVWPCFFFPNCNLTSTIQQLMSIDISDHFLHSCSFFACIFYLLAENSVVIVSKGSCEKFLLCICRDNTVFPQTTTENSPLALIKNLKDMH